MRGLRAVGPSFSGIDVLLAGAACSTFAAYSLVHGRTLYAVAACLLPLLVWSISRPVVLLPALGAAIPIFTDVAGHEGGGYNITSSDLFMVVIGIGIALQVLVGVSGRLVSALRPVALPALQYGAFVVLLLPFHPLGIGNLAQSGQRLELYLLPLVIGAFAALKGSHLPLLKAYVVSASALSLVWPLDNLGMQHNPVGQMIGNAILLLVGYPPLRTLRPCYLILVPGLLLTESRGAILATGIGLVVILMMQGLRLRLIVARALPLAAFAIAIFFFLPSTLRERVTTLSAPQNTALNTTASYPIFLRQEYTKDAKRIISAHPFTGIGVGNYNSADAASPYAVDDPHEVLYLQAAEGGYGFAVSFALLIFFSVVALRRMKSIDLAPVAMGVLIATVVHGLADIYWVRGTPVLGWLLLGMTCGLARAPQRAETPP